MPQFAAKKYLARRPTVITRIADYLAAHGAPPMVPHEPEPTSSSDSQETFVGGGAVPMGRKRRDSNASRRSSRSAASSTTGGAVGLPAHVELDKEGKAFEAVQTGFKLFRAMLGSASGGAWRVAKDQDGTRVWMRDREGEKQGEGLPIVKGEGEIEGVTTEQVLGTLMSESARRICAWSFSLSHQQRLTRLPQQGTRVSTRSSSSSSTTALTRASTSRQTKAFSRRSSACSDCTCETGRY